MRLGHDGISPVQQEYLEQARKRPSPPKLFSILSQLAEDSDLTSGLEPIHPEWLDIFDSAAAQLRSFKRFDEIAAFFDTLRPLDRSLARIDPASLTLCFLLGAGASKPPPSNIPIVRELLPQLLERGRRLGREDVTSLADFCEREQIDNIEDLLTAAQLATFCSRNPSVLGLMNYLFYRGSVDMPLRSQESDVPRWARYGPHGPRRPRLPAADLSSIAFLQDTLQVLFGLLSSTMLPAKPNPAHQAIADYANTHSSASIITTNYDCCMDLALLASHRQPQYMIEFANIQPGTADTINYSKLIKLHGSLNWYYCETCQEVQLVDIEQIVKAFVEDRSPYPVIGVCKNCGGPKRGLLVPPLAMKFDVAPPLTPLLSDARGTFESADLIVVVGFSFAEADVYISRMLSKSMQTNLEQKLVIVDPDIRVVERLRGKFKASVPGFDDSRIIKMSGDCALLLPQFLRGEMRELEQAELIEVPREAMTS